MIDRYRLCNSGVSEHPNSQAHTNCPCAVLAPMQTSTQSCTFCWMLLAPLHPKKRKKSGQAAHHALQLRHPVVGSAALSCSIALLATSSLESSFPAVLALRILSTSTVNLMASAAALVRR